MEKEILLTFDGGGSYGAWHVGVAKALVEKNYKTKALSGTSIGAIVALAYKANRVDELYSFFNNIRSINGVVDVLDFFISPWRVLFKGSVFSQRKLRKEIKKVISKEDYDASRDLELLVTAVSYNTGSLKIFSSKDYEYEDFLEIVLASCAIPGAFEPIKINDEYFVDGATREDIPIECIYEKYKEIDHVVCVCSPSFVSTKKGHGRFADVWLRGNELTSRESSDSDLRFGLVKNKEKIKIIRNETELMNSSLDYSGSSIKKLMSAGYLIGKNQL